MKRTAYQITGQSFEMPAAHLLPDGLEVEKVEVDDPKEVTVGNIFNNKTLTVRPSDGDVNFIVETESGLTRRMSLIVVQNSARQVRDCLNAILGDDESSPRPVASAPGSDEDQGRVFKDNDPGETWRWFETKPGLFTYAPLWDDAVEASANGRTSGCTDWPLAKLEEKYGPLTEVNP